MKTLLVQVIGTEGENFPPIPMERGSSINHRADSQLVAGLFGTISNTKRTAFCRFPVMASQDEVPACPSATAIISSVNLLINGHTNGLERLRARPANFR